MRKNLFINGAVAIIIVFLSINACKKSDDSYYIAGHIYSGCPSVVAPNVSIELYEEPDSAAGILTGKVLDVEKSDASGSFKVKTGFRGKISLRFADGTMIIPGLNSNNANHPYLKIYKTYSTHLKVSLSPSAPYTYLDTLFTTIPDSSGNLISIVGPFNSSVITIYNTDTLFKNIVRNDDLLSTRPTFSFHVNSGSVQTVVRYTLSLCDTSYAKIVLP